VCPCPVRLAGSASKLHSSHRLFQIHVSDSILRLKCNRATPCENCIKRGDALSCTYAQPGTRKKNSSTQGPINSPDDMQNRIDRLESLVLSLMTNGSQSAGVAAAAAALSVNDSIGTSQELDQDEDTADAQEDSDTEQVTKSFGVMKVDNKSAYYISEAHWASIINDVSVSWYRNANIHSHKPSDSGSSTIFCNTQKEI
jgi:Fungal Zn(2)-Cys(6) binuclear cluster domain